VEREQDRAVIPRPGYLNLHGHRRHTLVGCGRSGSNAPHESSHCLWGCLRELALDRKAIVWVDCLLAGNKKQTPEPAESGRALIVVRTGSQAGLPLLRADQLNVAFDQFVLPRVYAW
jgi:hypothetical protein